ncbi:MAG: hypothetical protein H6600_00540 [Flavobacteriales bacterium]|nr:hypothetical protein [Flavobacteriales bacterium]
MSEEIEALKNAIEISREQLTEDILAHLGIAELPEEIFNQIVLLIEKSDEKRFKYTKALESQEVVEFFLKDKLV